MDKKTGVLNICAFVTAVVICMIAAVVCCCNKQGMHEDEFYSYYSSNRTAGFYADGAVSREAVLDELRVLPGQGFNFPLVKEVQSWDVHPPMYYFLLHLACSVTPGRFSMWQGLTINLVCLLIALLLMKRLGDRLIPKSPIVVDIVCLAWGISAATLTGVVFIRMYMLLTVWILAVTLLHVSPAVREKANDPDITEASGGDVRMQGWFWPVLGVLTFLGFMTHYYFFIWLFFLAAVWNIREIIRTKSVRTTLLYGATMVVTFGLSYLFYPAFPAQMFRGQRGAQATGNFFDMGNTGERIAFFADKIDRIGFGGLLWIVVGLAVIACIMNADRLYGFKPKIGWSSVHDPRSGAYSAIRYEEADDAVKELMVRKFASRSRSFSDIKVMIAAILGYFLAVSKTALMLGDSSIRYVMPVLGILYLCLAAGCQKGISGIAQSMTRDESRGAHLGAIVTATVIGVIAIVNSVSDMHGNISFLYPEKSEHIATLSEYQDAGVTCVYPSGQSWIVWADMTELMTFDEVTYISEEECPDLADIEGIIFLDKGITVPTEAKLTPLYSSEYFDVYASK